MSFGTSNLVVACCELCVAVLAKPRQELRAILDGEISLSTSQVFPSRNPLLILELNQIVNGDARSFDTTSALRLMVDVVASSIAVKV